MKAFFYGFIIFLALSFSVHAGLKLPISPDEWQQAQQLPGIRVNFSPEAKLGEREVQMIFFFGPNNYYDAQIWQMLYGEEGFGKEVVSHWIPTSDMVAGEEEGVGRAFALLESGKASDLAHNFDHYDFEKKRGAATLMKGATAEALEQRQKKTRELLTRLYMYEGFPKEKGIATPFFLYRDNEGRLVKHYGLPNKNDLWIMVQLLPKEKSDKRTEQPAVVK